MTIKQSNLSPQEQSFRAYTKEKSDNALMSILSTEDGRWFLMTLFNDTRLFNNAFTGNSQTFFNEGLREAGRMIYNRINILGDKAVKLRQQGELEYAQTMKSFYEMKKGR